MEQGKPLYAAADIGGTKIRAGLVMDGGAVLGSRVFPTPLGAGAGEQAVGQLLSAWGQLCRERQIPWEWVAGFGLAVAGPVDIRRQTVENPYTLPG